LSSMGGLIFQEGGGSPPFTLKDEPHGGQEVATWVNLMPFDEQPILFTSVRNETDCVGLS
jgi:hypothetical protein